jgi:nucleoside phosphorylase
MAYPRSQADFPIAIICTLKVEYDAVSLLAEFSDEDVDRFGTAPGDDNIYKTGRMGNVNIILVHLQDKGTITAAVATSHLRSSFPKLKLVFLTGVCGGVPTAANQEIILGGVVISKSVFEHDRGSQYPAGFQSRHEPLEPTQSVQSLLVTLETNRWHNHLIAQAAGNLKLLQANAASQGQQSQYTYLGTVNDCLFPNTTIIIDTSLQWQILALSVTKAQAQLVVAITVTL